MSRSESDFAGCVGKAVAAAAGMCRAVDQLKVGHLTMWDVFVFDLQTKAMIHANEGQPLCFGDAIKLAGLLEDAESILLILPVR